MSEQQTLFDDEPAPWELDDATEAVVAEVVFPDGPSEPFSYRVPEKMVSRLAPGQRVRAPFGRGNRAAQGYCLSVGVRRIGPRPLKELTGLVDEHPLASAALMRVAAWMVDYYLCSWTQALETIIPAGVRAQAGTRAATWLRLSDEARRDLASLRLSKKQAEVVSFLAERDQPIAARELLETLQIGPSPVEALRSKKLIVAERRRVNTWAAERPTQPTEVDLDLNPDQQAALHAIRDALDAGRHETLLLHGITGSGKTEIYLQAIQHLTHFGRQAIVLVPEISLTPQTQARFMARFGRVAVLHSHMSDVERHRQWDRIASGEVAVVVGARSAIFAPLPQLGLIVLDEEHENSFKQSDAPRYHARNVALERARHESVPLILGSATPSLESYQKALSGEYRLLKLPKRVWDRPLPDVATIDLRLEASRLAAGTGLSRPLTAAMRAALDDGGQVILLLNRRGYSTHIQCPGCGYVVRCPHCEIALTHHKQGEVAICHYCDFETRTPTACPECDFAGIRFSGLGTQRLEAEVKARFPDHPCLRMDADSMQRPGSHERALAAFRSGEVKILLGTQIIAKGLDFPNVTLVGVVSADMALHLPDFRASERAFQLLVQVAGRSGRGERGGRVLVQTFSPDHPAVYAAVRHDYDDFVRHELPARQALLYPPFGQLLRLVIRGPVAAPAEAFAQALAAGCRTALDAAGMAYRLSGPAPAPLHKLRGNYRFQILLHSVDGAALRAAVKTLDHLPRPDNVLWIADVDPLEML